MPFIVQCLLLSCAILCCAAPARAHDTYIVHGTQIVEQEPAHRFARPRAERPSLFKYAYQGFAAGALAGLGAGYLVARADGFEGEDWRALAFGAGVGALTGATLGFTLGLLDRGGARSGHYVARDLSYGVGFGVLIGATGGGLSAILSHDPEHVLLGSAIGAVAGLALGVMTGVLEGSLRADAQHRYGARRVRVTAARSRLSQGWVPALVGTF